MCYVLVASGGETGGIFPPVRIFLYFCCCCLSVATAGRVEPTQAEGWCSASSSSSLVCENVPQSSNGSRLLDRRAKHIVRLGVIQCRGRNASRKSSRRSASLLLQIFGELLNFQRRPFLYALTEPTPFHLISWTRLQLGHFYSLIDP